MGKFVPRPRAPARIGRLLAVSLVPVAGCAHRDVVDTPVGWFHQLEGGVIAQQRPPPPGINDPYPKIGTTPAKAPEVASVAMRRTVTDALLRQRNLTTRLDANAPLPPPLPRVLQPASATSGRQGSSATLDAAAATSGGKAGSGPGNTDPAPELAMPALQLPAESAGNAVPVALPPVPGAPPPLPHLRGLDVAAAPTADIVPDYDPTPPAGGLIGFVANTDILLNGQEGLLHGITARRGAGRILVEAYGDASNTDLDAQAQAVSIAALRAGSVATALRAEGVPPDAIVLRAKAFGRGASVSLLQ